MSYHNSINDSDNYGKEEEYNNPGQNNSSGLTKEFGYLEPVCRDDAAREINGEISVNLTKQQVQEEIQRLQMQAEMQDEQVTISQIYVDSVKAKLISIAKGFSLISSKYSKISQSILSYEKNYFERKNPIFERQPQETFKQLKESIDTDSSESNLQIIVGKIKNLEAQLIQNQEKLIVKDKDKQGFQTETIENYSQEINQQFEICNAIVEKIQSSIGQDAFKALFAPELNNQLSAEHIEQLETKLKTTSTELQTCQLQKKSIESAYLSLRAKYTSLKATQDTDGNLNSQDEAEDSVLHNNLRNNSSEDNLQSQKHLIMKLIQNNVQLKELAEKVIKENKDLKSVKKIDSRTICKTEGDAQQPSTIITDKNQIQITATPAQLKHYQQRNSFSTQKSEFTGNISGFSPRLKELKSPSSRGRKVVFESIKSGFSRSPLRQSDAFQNTLHSINFENASTLNILFDKDREISAQASQINDLKRQLEQLREELNKYAQMQNQGNLQIEQRQTAINQASNPSNSNQYNSYGRVFPRIKLNKLEGDSGQAKNNGTTIENQTGKTTKMIAENNELNRQQQQQLDYDGFMKNEEISIGNPISNENSFAMPDMKKWQSQEKAQDQQIPVGDFKKNYQTDKPKEKINIVLNVSGQSN